MNAKHLHYDIKAIKSKIAPQDYYLKEQSLCRFKEKSSGWAEAGLCPFHEDSSAGSFWINLTNGAYKCFSCGAKGGDIITFTMTKYDLSFSEALKQIVREWGIS